jgi:hypothetical protein
MITIYCTANFSLLLTALFKLTGTLFNSATSNMVSTGIDLPFSAGSNKLERRSRARLSDFARELRLLRSVDMSGKLLPFRAKQSINYRNFWTVAIAKFADFKLEGKYYV